MPLYRKIISFLFIIFSLSAGAQTNNEWFQWKASRNMPPGVRLSGMIAGYSNGVLIIAGGSNFEANSAIKKYHRQIYVCQQPDADSLTWIEAGNLPYALADAAYVPYSNGIIFIGGNNEEKKFSTAGFLYWDARSQTVKVSTTMVPLPSPRSGLAATITGYQLFVAGGKNERNEEVNDFWTLDLSNFSAASNHSATWKQLPAWPGLPRFGASLLAQTDGEKTLLFLFGGKSGTQYLRDGYKYYSSAKEQRWQPIRLMPRAAYFAAAVPYGQSHILVLGGSDGHQADSAIALGDRYKMPSDILAYHTITDTWVKVGNLPEGVAGAGAFMNGPHLILVGGELRPRIRSGNILTGTISSQSLKSDFKWLDYCIVIGYLVLLAAISYHFSRRKQTSESYFRGSQKIPYWAVGISVMATQVSAIGFMSIPAKAYATNWTYFSGVWTWFLVVPIVTWAFIPFFRKLNLTSAYEYLEQRFSSQVRLLSAIVYCLYQIGRMGLVVYLPAVALSAVAPLDTISCILIMGLLSTVYTVLGGIEAVIWIEVIQAILLMGGAIVCVILAINGIDGGMSGFWQTAVADDKFSVGSLNLDFSSSSLIVLLIGNIFIRLGNLISDQAIVQRYMTTKSVKDARKSLWMDVKVSIPWAIIIYLLGTALYVYYKNHPGLLNPSLPTDGILPSFVAHTAPSGLSGLIIAAVFAASMATIESHIHSVATIFTIDLYGRRARQKSSQQQLKTAKVTTVVLGLLATMLAVILLYFDIKSILDLFTELTGVFLGASAGLFLLGIFTTRANSTGAVAGAIISSLIILSLQRFSAVNFWLYSAIGMLSCLLIGYLFSFFLTGRKSIEGLTIYSINQKNKETNE